MKTLNVYPLKHVRIRKWLNFFRKGGNTETQRNPFSYLLEVTHIHLAIRLLAEVQKSFSECWVLLPYTVSELFNNHILGHSTFTLSGLGSKITSRHTDAAEHFL